MDLVTVLRVAFSLVVVFGLLWLSYRIAGRGARSTAKAAGAQLSVVARQGLTGKSAAVLLQAGGTQYLLGVTESSVTLIDRQDAPQPADVPATVPAASPAARAAVPAAALPTTSAVPAEPLFDDAVMAAQDWLVRAGAAPDADIDEARPDARTEILADVPAEAPTEPANDVPVGAPHATGRPALPDALRTFLAPATWRRSALTVWAGRR
ncbi:flagellar biosynthetic protein FliO [Isoptericola sp. NEAU-Y5]|uniref:Flagellar biosynthetic protein FliO n=1 Tax=Isoptericola luteus TaxID=2879484 RepID=A0ABS7ZJB9_9MICO|nr:flagellar biosynthetic protein FliO [Isoptericola sp. NEAU-Y5]MCA5895121.1 flagellar biosynthetic protein FliO [Isoptericola sp. NEAU-Y5]